MQVFLVHLELMGVKPDFSLLLFVCRFSVMHIWCGVLQSVDFPIRFGLFLSFLQGMNRHHFWVKHTVVYCGGNPRKIVSERYLSYKQAHVGVYYFWRLSCQSDIEQSWHLLQVIVPQSHFTRFGVCFFNSCTNQAQNYLPVPTEVSGNLLGEHCRLQGGGEV